MKVKLISVLLVFALATTGVARAESLDKEMSALAGSLSKALVAQGSKNVAAVDFTDLQGQPTELGRFLSEQLAVAMVLTAGVSMLDRANIKSILAEHKLTEEGLVNPANAKKLGEFAGVDAILIGNVTSLDAGIVLMVKAISTGSAKIVAAGRITFPKTSDIQQLLNRGISSSVITAAPPTTSATRSTGTGYQEANAIATKDIGSLRVILKSVLPMHIRDANRTDRNGIRCSFDFINRETQRSLVVAVTAAPPGNSATRMGELLRSTLTDERGGIWRTSTSSVRGIGAVGVGSRDWFNRYNPSEIVSLLVKRDKTNTDVLSDPKAPFVFGVTISIPPGQSAAVTIAFFQETLGTASSPSPKFFQIDSEVVVGLVAADSTKSYSLHNLSFDRVSMPAGRF